MLDLVCIRADHVAPLVSEQELYRFFSESYFDFPLVKDVRYDLRLAVYSLLYKRLIRLVQAEIIGIDYPRYGNMIVGTPSGAIDIWTNVSYSGNYVMCGICDSPVGVDVQKIRKLSDIAFYAIASPLEQSNVASKDASYRCQLFSLKESFGKAMQSGILWPADYPTYGDGFTLVHPNSAAVESHPVLVEDSGYVGSITVVHLCSER